MTEAEWLTCTDPTPMLDLLRENASDRKLRLFAVACARHVIDCFADERARHSVRIAEDFADGQATQAELVDARDAAWDLVALAERPVAERLRRFKHNVAHASYFLTCQQVESRHVVGCCSELVPDPPGERSYQTALIRCIFGTPHRPTNLEASLLTDRVMNLAKAIYSERAWNRLPILADALEENGCREAVLLEHSREPGPHCRGCFALDAVLGKK